MQVYGSPRGATEKGIGINRSASNIGEGVHLSGNGNDGLGWVRSPVLPSQSHGLPSWNNKAKHKDAGDFEHIEDVKFQDIPHLNLACPLLRSPKPHHATIESSTPKRPSFSTASSSSSMRSASPFGSPKSPAATLSPPPRTSPRRIQSTSALSGFALHLQTSYDDEHHHTSSSRHFSLNLFKSPSKAHSLSTSTTLISPEPFLTIPTSPLDSMTLTPPSMRKRTLSSGLLMTHKTKKGRDIPALWLTENDGRHDTSAMHVTSSPNPTSPGMENLKTLVDEWTRSGPANKTVMVSVLPTSQCR